MNIPVGAPLFAWQYLEDSPSLKTVGELLTVIPDERLIELLQKRRGRGRNDYPVQVLWGTELLTAVLRHPTTEACLEELRRNVGLRLLIGIESEEGVPKPCNMSRFRAALGSPEIYAELRNVFAEMVRVLASTVESLGQDCAADSTGLSARPDRGSAPEHLPQPDGGRKEYTDEDGNVTEVLEWFGYKLHLLVDTRHEVALSYHVTNANSSDCQSVPQLVEDAQAVLPEGRMRTLAYDKAADTVPVHEALAEAAISPVIRNRKLWADTQPRVLPGERKRPVNVFYDEAGTIYCARKGRDRAVLRPMAYVGYEKGRGTLKYRCPAYHQGWECPNEPICNRGKRYGLTVRVKQELDIRRFPAVPRATQKFERLYRGRTAVERVNSRLKVFWGIDDGNVVGASRFHARVGAVMVVHAAFAHVLAAAPREGTSLGALRLGPVQEALRRAGRI